MSQICNLNGGNFDDDAECAEEFTESLSRYRWFFNLGQFLNGIGAAPLITLGTTLLDESVSKKNSPMYIGIFQVHVGHRIVVLMLKGNVSCTQVVRTVRILAI